MGPQGEHAGRGNYSKAKGGKDDCKKERGDLKASTRALNLGAQYNIALIAHIYYTNSVLLQYSYPSLWKNTQDLTTNIFLIEELTTCYMCQRPFTGASTVFLLCMNEVREPGAQHTGPRCPQTIHPPRAGRWGVMYSFPDFTPRGGRLRQATKSLMAKVVVS